MLEHSPHTNVRPSSERSFGLVFATILVAVALYPLLDGGSVRWLSAGGAFLLAGVALICPGVLRRPNRWWFRFGMLLGRIVGPIVMALVFVAVVVPTGVLMRMFSKDQLKAAPDKRLATYWIERDWPIQPMDRQF